MESGARNAGERRGTLGRGAERWGGARNAGEGRGTLGRGAERCSYLPAGLWGALWGALLAPPRITAARTPAQQDRLQDAKKPSETRGLFYS